MNQNTAIYHKNSCFARIMAMQEQGVLFKMKKSYWPRLNTCERPDEAKAMGLNDLQSVFYLLFGIALGFSFCVLLIEILYHYCTTSTLTGWSRDFMLVMNAITKRIRSFSGKLKKRRKSISNNLKKPINLTRAKSGNDVRKGFYVGSMAAPAKPANQSLFAQKTQKLINMQMMMKMNANQANREKPSFKALTTTIAPKNNTIYIIKKAKE